MPRRNYNELREQLAARVPNFEERMAELRRESEIERARYSQTLGQIRKAKDLTQVEVARRLGVSQAQVSRVENQTDLYLSTLEGYLAAVGAEIEVAACFPDGSRIPLSFTELTRGGGGDEPVEGRLKADNGSLGDLPDSSQRIAKQASSDVSTAKSAR
jgi:transcriptional regulator with XRE-family HTH domain